MFCINLYSLLWIPSLETHFNQSHQDFHEFQWSVLKLECHHKSNIFPQEQSLFITLYIDNLVYAPNKKISIQKTFQVPENTIQHFNLNLQSQKNCLVSSQNYYKILQMSYWNHESQSIKLPGFYSQKCLMNYDGISHSFEVNDLMKSCFYQEIPEEYHPIVALWIVMSPMICFIGWIYSGLLIIHQNELKDSFQETSQNSQSRTILNFLETQKEESIQETRKRIPCV